MSLPTVTSQPSPAAFLRSQMPIVDRFAYFDHAAVSPLPAPTRKAMSAYLDQAEQTGDTSWGEWAKGVESLRRRAAECLGCQADEIALIPNTTFGINLVACGSPWKPGDNVVIPDREFPSNSLPWKLLAKRGVEVRVVANHGQIETSRLIEAIDHRTRVVSVSWVDYATGYRVDLAELCERVHHRGARLFVDAIQGLGAFPLSLKDIPIDFLAADGHKWMLGPEGAGLLFIRQASLEWLEPIMMGWGSVEQPHQFSSDQMQLKAQASRYEGGSANMVGLLGLGESLRLLMKAGCHRSESGFAETILEQTARLQSGLEKLGASVHRHPVRNHQSGIVSFAFPGSDSYRLRQALLEKNIVVSVRLGRLRAALHAYNTEHEVNQMLSALAILKA